MIVRVPRNKRCPLLTLAWTASGERACYVEPGMSMQGGSESVASSDGDEWMPYLGEGKRLTIFIPGNPGAGKSFLASELVEMFPEDYEVLLFTSIEDDDGNFEEFKDRTYRIRMEADNLARLTLGEIRKRVRNPILLFDDVDKIRDKQVEKQVFKLLEDALANGRGHRMHDGEGDIHVIVTSHALNDFRKTKFSLENSEYVAIFPGSTTYSQMELLCKKIGVSSQTTKLFHGLGKEGIRRIIIHKNAPMYYIAGDIINLL